MKNKFTIREFRYDDKDYQNIASLESLIWSNHPVTAKELEYHDKNREKKYLFKRFIIEYSSTYAGHFDYGERQWAYIKGGYFIHILILSEYRKMGVGSLAYNYILEQLSKKELVKLSAHTCEDQPEGIKFFKKRGFEQTMREPNSYLDVQSFKFNRYRQLIDKLKEKGIEIIPFSKAESVINDLKNNLYEVDWLIAKDIPFTDPPTKPSYQVWEPLTFQPGNFNPRTYIVAIDDNKIIGISCIKHFLANKKNMYTSITGTIRSHRRMGIATAMKAFSIEKAKEIGIQRIITDNEEKNPMYTLNMKLGFKPLPAWVQYEKKF